MSTTEKEWIPPAKIEELYAATSGNKFGNINAPTSGARIQQDLPAGNAPFQLYSLCTPNGQKISIMLEELGIDYDAHGQQFIYTSCKFILYIYMYDMIWLIYLCLSHAYSCIIYQYTRYNFICITIIITTTSSYIYSMRHQQRRPVYLWFRRR